MKIDSAPPKASLAEFTRNETRFHMLERIDPKRSAELMEKAAASVKERYALYEHLAASLEPAPVAPAIPADPEQPTT